VATPCQDDYPSIPSWCGSDTPAPGLEWSFDSGLIAFRTSDTALLVRDLRTRTSNSIESPTQITSACVAGCATGFRFQP
jgi:hypothetical protein